MNEQTPPEPASPLENIPPPEIDQGHGFARRRGEKTNWVAAIVFIICLLAFAALLLQEMWPNAINDFMEKIGK